MTEYTTSAKTADNDQLEQNKQTVRAFYKAAIIEKNFETAQTLIGRTYTQHNPQIGDGAEGLKSFIAFLKDTLSLGSPLTSSAWSPRVTTWSGTSMASGFPDRLGPRSLTSSGSRTRRSSNIGM